MSGDGSRPQPEPRPGEFSGTVAVVTGGGSGIGRATAQTLMARGAHVAILDIALQDTPPGALAIATDVADSDAVESAIQAVVDRLGGIDVLVNNAGIPAFGTVTDNDDEEWRRVLDVNVVGMVRASRAVVPHMRRSRTPAIVNTCSVAATTGLPDLALYSASKGAVLALTLAMAADYLGVGIRVNCVSPGTVDSPWLAPRLRAAPDPEALRAALRSRQPMSRLISTEEVADAIAYLASPRAGSTTGTSLTVDGGLTGVRLPGTGAVSPTARDSDGRGPAAPRPSEPPEQASSSAPVVS